MLCSLCSKYIHSPLAPWCLAAGIREYAKGNFEYKVVEGTINESIEKVAERIIAENPEIIGLSCYIWNINSVKILGEMLKKALPSAVIVLGGPEVSYNARKAISLYSFCDYIIAGEGEVSFPKFCDTLVTDRDFSFVPGLCYKTEDKIIENGFSVGTGEPPSPYCEEYFSALKGRICYLETSRGCPYSCAFCLSSRCALRFFDIERAKREMLLLAKSGTQTVKLVDRTFNANKERAKELWRFIIEHYGNEIPAGVCFHFEIAGDILDEESIEILNSAPKGSMQLEIGLQSFNEKTLSYINRKTNTKKLRENIVKLLTPANIHIHIDLIAGLPFEDLESFRDSFNIAFNLKPNMLQLGFLKLLHGAAMREDKEKYPSVYSKEPPYEVISTPWTSEEDLALLHKTEDALERLYNSGRFIDSVEYVLSSTGKMPFDFFRDFGIYAAERSKLFISLDDYTEIAYSYMSSLPGVEPSVLKDKMICDRLCSNSSGKLPKVLKVENPQIKKIRLFIESQEEFKRKAGIKRGFALLESEKAAAVCDYTDKDPVSGKFVLKKVYYNIDEE